MNTATIYRFERAPLHGQSPIVFTATPIGETWRVKIIEDGGPRYQGNYPDRKSALLDAEMLATERGGCFLR